MPQGRGETRGCRDAHRILEHAQRGPVVVGRGVGEVAEQPDDPQPADALEPRGLREHDAVVLGGDAVARQPGLELEVHPDGTIAGCRRRGLQQLIEVRDPQLDPHRGRLDERGARRVQPREDRRGDAAAAQREGLADVGDAEPGRAALERRDRRAHGAVAVAVGLDDGDHLGVGESAQVPHVRG